ncbi:MAG: hypothetical protein FJY55_11700 [Betaproteobacteria bacterium]|nr:hypothetical protein [Betaproteobacteria bacterium]
MRVPALLLLPLLAGCGTWVNTRDPGAHFGEQMRLCEAEAWTKHPPLFGWMSPFSGFLWGPSCFQTARGLVCQTFPTLREWPVADDLSASLRRLETRECLGLKGWTWVPKSQAGTEADSPPASNTGPAK